MLIIIIITCDEEVKLLGVTIDFKLKFNTQVPNVRKKASRQLSVLKRIGKNLCKLGKFNIYHVFIMSNFNYSPLTWHFCGEVNTKKLEKIQKRALRFIYNDYISDYHELLHKSKLPSLKKDVLEIWHLNLLKLFIKQCPAYLHDLISIKNSPYSFRYTYTAEMPKVRTTGCGLNYFRYGAAKLWNSSPQNFRDETNFNQFRSLVNTWSGEGCRCSCCVASQ